MSAEKSKSVASGGKDTGAISGSKRKKVADDGKNMSAAGDGKNKAAKNGRKGNARKAGKPATSSASEDVMTAHCPSAEVVADEDYDALEGQEPRYKAKPRSYEIKRVVELRLNRASGQLRGIKAMVDDDRYCGDIIIQLSAVISALERTQQIILKDHLETCVVDRITAGDLEVVDEFAQLLKLSKISGK